MRTVIAKFIIKVRVDSDQRIDRAIADFLHRLSERDEIANGTYDKKGCKFYFTHVEKAAVRAEHMTPTKHRERKAVFEKAAPRDQIAEGEITASWKQSKRP